MSVLSTRYYLKRLWKVSYTRTQTYGGRVRLCKFYEKRSALGKPWTLVRAIITEMTA